MRIVSVGGGPAGLGTAILAARQGHEVTVHDRYPRGETYGWGVVFWDGLIEELAARDEPTARAVRAAAFRWQDQLVAVAGADPVRIPGSGYAMGRHELLRILAARAEELGVRLRFGREAGPGDVASAELVVAADGAGSRTRRLETGFGTRVTHGRNRYTWLGTPRVLGSFTFPFVRSDAGWVWAHTYPFDARTSTFVVEMAPGTWTGLGLDRRAADDALRLLEGLFAEHLQGAPLRAPAGAGHALRWSQFPAVTNERWHAGRVVLAGDAAHTTHFSIGSGTRLALEDAMALTDALADGGPLEAALEAYGRRRAEALAEAQAVAANSAQWFEHLPRYIDREPEQFARLLDLRRSSVLQRVPPAAYLRLSHAAATVPGLGAVGDLVRRGRRMAAQAPTGGAAR